MLFQQVEYTVEESAGYVIVEYVVIPPAGGLEVPVGWSITFQDLDAIGGKIMMTPTLI